jgi:cyclopropane fatty-acyl-phospholipid synthase-like methyltransferase
MNHRKHVGDINLFDYTGKYCFDLLIGLNLQKKHKLLDVGCGALRTGKFLINYLDCKNYTGLEPDIEILESAKKSEINESFLKQKEPNFIINSSFNFEDIPIQDFIFCFDVFYHCGINQLNIFLKNVKEISNNKTNIVLSLMFANGNPHETQKGVYHYKYASHSNVYYDIDQFIILALQHGFQANLLNKNEKHFFGSRLIFQLKKIIKLI